MFHMVTHFFVGILFSFVYAKSELNCTNFPACIEQSICDECIQFHPCCNWCFDEYYNEIRCNVMEKLKNCSEIEKSEQSSYKKKSKEFQDVKEEIDPIQIKPQQLKIKLRINDPITVPIEYRLAKDYPLDLYYLMDLTYSMSQDIHNMEQLGKKLTEVLKNITENYRVAFGAYSDKEAMPYYFTANKYFSNPCSVIGEACEPGFDFRHRLNFTKNISEFTKEVGNSKITANVDNLEGGLDALMQIILCGDYMNWMKTSRKLVVVATDGIMHMAGDGLLAGAVKRNVDECSLDAKGNYAKSLIYDYPSVEEIFRKLSQKKMNVIFAPKQQVIDYYKQITDLIPEVAFIAELKGQSENVVNVVKDGYHNFIKHVKFVVDTSHTPELNITFHTTCNQGFRNTSSSCYNVMEGENYTFDVTFELIKEPENKNGVTLKIEEKSISEFVDVKIEYVGMKCKCQSKSNPQNDTEKCNNQGTWRCNKCDCLSGWTGETCTERCETVDLETCRMKTNNTISTTCNSRGECICGKCTCDFRYAGDYCEYVCPVYNRQVCSGNGKCEKGICYCNAQYEKEDCSCLKSTSMCKAPGEIRLCSNSGSCDCGKCKCSKGFSGNYCEKCDKCDGLCSLYQDCIAKILTNETNPNCTSPNGDSYKVNVNKVERSLRNEDDSCYIRINANEAEIWQVYYLYKIEGNSSVSFTIEKIIASVPIKPAFTALIVVVSIFVIGIIGLCIWKRYHDILDKREYEKFYSVTVQQQEKLRISTGGGNPLFKSPVSEYEVPEELQLLQIGS